MKIFQKGDADAIVTVGGDGILHEVINGLLKREDWKSVCHTPIAPIAAGSSSAINKNLDTLKPLSAALSVIKGMYP
jgi:sphingosine kinase